MRKNSPRKSSKRNSAAEFAKKREPVPLAKLAITLRRGNLTLAEVAEKFGTSEGCALDGINALIENGLLIQELGGMWGIARHQDPAKNKRRSWEGPDYRFGLIADTHHGSVHCREDVVEELYDWYAAEGIKRVYHCGNWIDGEAKFNKFELIDQAHGSQKQIDYFVKTYPQRKGIKTYYVAGDDHEGWYFQREGIDIGRVLQNTAEAAGRQDLVNLGYKEAFIELIHPETKRTSTLLIDHPGGGSSYATSYAPQKRIEAAQSGEKPGIWCFGHWHKSGFFQVGHTFAILVPCCKDLDTFGRKKGLQYHVGGVIVDAEQDPGGAITKVIPQFKMYMDRGYHSGQYTPDKSTKR